MDSNHDSKVKQPSSGRHALRYLLTLIVLGLAVHLILPQIASLEHSYEVIKDMVLWAFVLACLAQVGSYLGSGYLLSALARLSKGTLSIIRGTMITIAGYSFGMVAGGMVGSSAAIYRWMQKENVPSETATLAGTIPAVFNDIVLLLVSLIGLGHLLLVHQLSRLQGISFAAIVVVIVGLIVVTMIGLRKRDSLTQFAGLIGRRWANFRKRDYYPQKTEDWLNNLFEAVNTLMSGGWRGTILGEVFNVTFDMLTLYFLFIAAGHRVSIGVLLTGYGLPLLLGKMAFFLPGGVGVIESTMTGLYVSLGVPDAVTVVVVLAYRFLSFWLPLLLGFPMILVLQKKNPEVSSPAEGS